MHEMETQDTRKKNNINSVEVGADDNFGIQSAIITKCTHVNFNGFCGNNSHVAQLLQHKAGRAFTVFLWLCQHI